MEAIRKDTKGLGYSLPKSRITGGTWSVATHRRLFLQDHGTKLMCTFLLSEDGIKGVQQGGGF